MAEINKKRVVIAALIGGLVFCGIVTLFDHFLLEKEFSWIRLALYFLFAVVMYGFLTYRALKKQQKK
ncbi:hypothetical protein [uncultured Psychroserpens sp.]|uniref:hypothetical protein n=1 Tax=uncultured Psychroserpens sp. TaxID=255436 RepID=UPI0026221ED8|nr:hypothetical protein [uncultured Psychroserpens sp.]